MADNHCRHVSGERHSKFILGSTLDEAGLLWTGYPDGIRAMPLGRLLYIDAEWGHQPGRAHKKLAEVVREACEEQLRIGPAAL